MQQDICNGTVSVCLSRLSTAAAACVGFAAMGSAGRISIDFCAAGAQHQLRAVSCGQLILEAEHTLVFVLFYAILRLCLQCLDAVGWAAGRASGL